MQELQDADNLYLILLFLVPGFIVLFVRSQFVTGRSPSRSTTVLSYLIVSIIYYALALPFIDLVLSPAALPKGDGDQEPGLVKGWTLAAWFGLIVLGPAILGLVLGANVQKDLLRRVLQWCRLNPVHVVPTAWDWKFGGMPPQWVLVTLKDGTRFAGFCGSDSFMSSDPTERDIYIERIYDVDDENNWNPRGENSVLISPGEIQTIEFWPDVEQETANDER